MSLKQDIETWVAALAHYDNNEFEEAIRTFTPIADTSKVWFNCGVIHATLGEHEKAITCYTKAVDLDQYLAVAYFQQGVSCFLMGDFEEALANFNDTLLYLRGNNNIDYEQLGLKFKLFSCEVLFNRGLCYIYLQQIDAGLQDLGFAAKEKAIPDHDVIDEAIREKAEGYTVFSIPVGLVYRPNEAKVKNLAAKDYLGKARLVAASERSDAFTGFTGVEKMRTISQAAQDDRPDNTRSYAATNLVKSDLQRRNTRQQSAPPLNRTAFPPTPPPENDRPTSINTTSEPRETLSRYQSVRGAGPKPQTADARKMSHDVGDSRQQYSTTDRAMPYDGEDARQVGAAPGRKMSYDVGDRKPMPEARDQKTSYDSNDDPGRLGTARSASERRRPAEADPFARTRDPWRKGSIDAREANAAPRRGGNVDDDSLSPRQDDGSERYNQAQGIGRKMSQASGAQSRTWPPRNNSILEEDEAEADPSADEFDEGEFEMVSRARSAGAAAAAQRVARRPSTRVDVKKIRVKVHAKDTRYVVVGAKAEFAELVDQICVKFGLRSNFKLMMKDDADFITMSDQDDLDLALTMAKDEARREGSEMGKFEVWIEEVN